METTNSNLAVSLALIIVTFQFHYPSKLHAQEYSIGLDTQRLFMSGEERAQIDNDTLMVSESLPSSANLNVTGDAEVQQTKVMPNKQLTLNGLVVRSDGKLVVWLNGEQQELNRDRNNQADFNAHMVGVKDAFVLLADTGRVELRSASVHGAGE